MVLNFILCQPGYQFRSGSGDKTVSPTPLVVLVDVLICTSHSGHTGMPEKDSENGVAG